jgi:hypothetical protein
MQEDIIKENLEEFDKKISTYDKDEGFIVYEEGYDCNDFDVDLIRKWIEKKLLSAVSQAKEEGIKQGVEEYKKELREKIEIIKLEIDTVICDCGEPYKDSDLAILIKELKDLIN